MRRKEDFHIVGRVWSGGRCDKTVPRREKVELASVVWMENKFERRTEEIKGGKG